MPIFPIKKVPIKDTETKGIVFRILLLIKTDFGTEVAPFENVC